MAGSDILQYGALGLLAAFIGGFVLWLRERDRAAEQRQAASDAFSQQLIQKVLDARDLTAEAEAKALRDLVRDVTEVQGRTNATLSELVQAIRSNGECSEKMLSMLQQMASNSTHREERAEERHQALMGRLA
jgi:hypothetical protein